MEQMNGNRSKGEIGERSNPTVRSRMFVAFRAMSNTYGPTKMHKESLEIGKKELEGITAKLENYSNKIIPELERALEAAGAPWIEGQALPRN